jgi:glucokinase
MFIAGDIGGTKSNLAIYELHTAGTEPVFAKTLSSQSYATLTDLIMDFLGSTDQKVKRAYFSIAGAVINGMCKTTNLPWEVCKDQLEKETGLIQIELVNDLVANAYGIGLIADKDFVVLNEGDSAIIGNAVVISAGTGLGEAGLYWDGQRHHPFASEGGHSTFSPGDELQTDLMHFLRKSLAEAHNISDYSRVHVSTERVLSGSGIHSIYKFLRERGVAPEPAWIPEAMKSRDPAAVITEGALEKNVELCVKTLEVFCTIYGSEAGNLALKFLSTGGVYVGGGIAPKILPKLKEPFFREAFIAKGRMGDLLETIPVKVILNDKAALLGAVRAGREQFSRLESSIR